MLSSSTLQAYFLAEQDEARKDIESGMMEE
jgi:hypothetical protein